MFYKFEDSSFLNLYSGAKSSGAESTIESFLFPKFQYTTPVTSASYSLSYSTVGISTKEVIPQAQYTLSFNGVGSIRSHPVNPSSFSIAFNGGRFSYSYEIPQRVWVFNGFNTVVKYSFVVGVVSYSVGLSDVSLSTTKKVANLNTSLSFNQVNATKHSYVLITPLEIISSNNEVSLRRSVVVPTRGYILQAPTILFTSDYLSPIPTQSYSIQFDSILKGVVFVEGFFSTVVMYTDVTFKLQRVIPIDHSPFSLFFEEVNPLGYFIRSLDPKDLSLSYSQVGYTTARLVGIPSSDWSSQFNEVLVHSSKSVSTQGYSSSFSEVLKHRSLLIESQSYSHVFEEGLSYLDLYRAVDSSSYSVGFYGVGFSSTERVGAISPPFEVAYSQVLISRSKVISVEGVSLSFNEVSTPKSSLESISAEDFDLSFNDVNYLKDSAGLIDSLPFDISFSSVGYISASRAGVSTASYSIDTNNILSDYLFKSLLGEYLIDSFPASKSVARIVINKEVNTSFNEVGFTKDYRVFIDTLESQVSFVSSGFTTSKLVNIPSYNLLTEFEGLLLQYSYFVTSLEYLINLNSSDYFKDSYRIADTVSYELATTDATHTKFYLVTVAPLISIVTYTPIAQVRVRRVSINSSSYSLTLAIRDINSSKLIGYFSTQSNFYDVGYKLDYYTSPERSQLILSLLSVNKILHKINTVDYYPMNLSINDVGYTKSYRTKIVTLEMTYSHEEVLLNHSVIVNGFHLHASISYSDQISNLDTLSKNDVKIYIL